MDKAIIARFLNGTATVAEVEQVMRWLGQPHAGQELEKLFTDVWEEEGLRLQDELRRQRLHHQINEALQRSVPDSNSRRSSGMSAFLRTAATWILLLGVAYLGLRVIRDNRPGLEDQIGTVQWVEKTVLPGQKLQLELPDHTKVWVNANSEIRFPKAFSSDFRDVYLDGEAFFEVQQESARPFRVFAGGITTEVLGTRFNIKVQEEKTELALLDGSVRVNIGQNRESQRVLSPGQQATYYPDTSDFLRIRSFDREKAFLWKDRIIHFENQRFATIIPMLENWYGVSIHHSGRFKNKDRRVSGTFSNDNLENLLIGLGFTLDFTFELRNDTVTLYPQ
ncbi:FecR family protein [Cyclobacterium xiamenense]|uniref:FecR family protein n=1 Tax=Cyclobacterium xiamenense TaxID=1297121 RepID=UPI0012B6B1B0|nr:FecR domain-containing protein [Cyclobacterium xiamenense]